MAEQTERPAEDGLNKPELLARMEDGAAKSPLMARASDEVAETPKSALLAKLEAFGDPGEWGRPLETRWWVAGQVDYVGRLGLSAEDAPELMVIARRWMEPQDDWPDDDNYVAGYAPVHAWRCLAQLRAAGTVAMLLEMLDPLDAGDDDWFLEEFPAAFRYFGEEAVGPLCEYLADSTHGMFARATVAEGVRHLAADCPAVRGQAVRAMLDVLSREEITDTDAEVNGYIVAELLDLVRDKIVAAEEIAEVIERAHAADRVFLGVCGNWNKVRAELGVAGLGLVSDELANCELSLVPPPDNEHEGEWADNEDDALANLYAPNHRGYSSDPAAVPILRSAPKIGRNDPCPCGSGKKYKKCCAR